MTHMRRVGVLREAELAITGARNESYGEPEDNFTVIADLWSAYLEHDVTNNDVAAMMVLLKIARSKNDPAVQDNWVDIAGYAACAGEVTHGPVRPQA